MTATNQQGSQAGDDRIADIHFQMWIERFRRQLASSFESFYKATPAPHVITTPEIAARSYTDDVIKVIGDYAERLAARRAIEARIDELKLVDKLRMAEVSLGAAITLRIGELSATLTKETEL